MMLWPRVLLVSACSFYVEMYGKNTMIATMVCRKSVVAILYVESININIGHVVKNYSSTVFTLAKVEKIIQVNTKCTLHSILINQKS